jgi:hypothetical protein
LFFVKFEEILARHFLRNQISNLFEVFKYIKSRKGDLSDPLVYSVMKNSRDIEVNELEEFEPENFFNLNFIYQNKALNTFSTFKVQLSVINIQDRNYFNFDLEDISMRRQVSQIQQEAIK